jgi:hypothetical protein
MVWTFHFDIDLDIAVLTRLENLKARRNIDNHVSKIMSRYAAHASGKANSGS